MSASWAIPEIVSDARILVDPDDPEEITEVIRKVLSDESSRKKLIARGLNRVREFTWEKTAGETLAVYEKAYKIWQDSQ